MGLAFKNLDPSLPVKVDSFDCGEPELNEFLQEDALDFIEKGLSAIRVLVDESDNRVIAYSAISPLSLNIRSLTKEQQVHFGVPFPIPAWLIGRLAVDKTYQKQHLGAFLLFDAIESILKRAVHGAGAFIVVDAKNENVKKFYTHHAFTELPTSKGLRLEMPIALARKLLSLPQS